MTRVHKRLGPSQQQRIEKAYRLTADANEFRLREFFRQDRPELASFGEYSTLIPSSQPIWAAYRADDTFRGSQGEYVIHLSVLAAQARPPPWVSNLLRKAKLDCAARLREALADYHSQLIRNAAQKTATETAPAPVAGTG